MSPDLTLYAAQFLAATVFAIVVEFTGLRKRAEPGRVHLLATWGIAQVGLIVAARLALAPVPALRGADAAWWTWWLVFWSFLAAALPIWSWQLALESKRVRATLARWERWHGKP